MILDWDDFAEDNHRLDLFAELKKINPAFKATVFAVPGKCSPEFLDSLPDWLELAVHGWMHPHPYECAEWDYARMEQAIMEKPSRFVDGWKSPGWQTSDDVYECLEDHGWWIADQHLEDYRRPIGMRTYLYEDGDDRWHGHIQDVCGNGLAETWDHVCRLVAESDVFRFASEAVVPWVR